MHHMFPATQLLRTQVSMYIAKQNDGCGHVTWAEDRAYAVCFIRGWATDGLGKKKSAEMS